MQIRFLGIVISADFVFACFPERVFSESVSPSMAVMADWSGFGALGA